MYTHNVSVWGQNLLSFTEEQVSKNLFSKRVSLANIYITYELYYDTSLEQITVTLLRLIQHNYEYTCIYVYR